MLWIFWSFLLISFIFKNLLELSIKHLVFLLTGSFFSIEFLLLTIFGFLQSLFLLKCHLGLKQNRHTNILNCICYSIQVLMLVLIGIVQFLNDMTIWDHKYFLNNQIAILYYFKPSSYSSFFFLPPAFFIATSNCIISLTFSDGSLDAYSDNSLNFLARTY